MSDAGGKLLDRATITVRQMIAIDVPAVVSILGESAEASMWPEKSVLEWSSKGSTWVGERNGSVAGILIGRAVADEFEILNLAVGQASRRLGVATRLVAGALEWSRAAGGKHTYLEVRASNEGGIAFYAKMGFRVCGRRQNYYRDPAEDAVLMELS